MCTRIHNTYMWMHTLKSSLVFFINMTDNVLLFAFLAPSLSHPALVILLEVHCVLVSHHIGKR